MRERKSCRPISPMTRLSIEIFPPAASIKRNTANVMDDLPAPVRPTMPICLQSQSNFHSKRKAFPLQNKSSKVGKVLDDGSTSTRNICCGHT